MMKKNHFIYADYAASCPMNKSSLSVLRHTKNVYGNANSQHLYGQRMAFLLESARERIAAIIGAEPQEIYFTSGGTEANNIAIQTLAALNPPEKGTRLVCGAMEHHSVLEAVEARTGDMFSIPHFSKVDYLPGWSNGKYNLSLLRNSSYNAAVMMLANNETGVMQPFEGVGEYCRNRGMVFFCDGVSAVGHVPINVKETGINLLSASAHKFGGPPGVGLLYCDKNIKPAPIMLGGGQEGFVRPGSSPVFLIGAMCAALEESVAKMRKEKAKLNCFTRLFEREIADIPETMVIHSGHAYERIPGITNVCFSWGTGAWMVGRLNEMGIAASAGAACTSGSLEPSHVLTAMGIPEKYAQGSVRFSFGAKTTRKDVLTVASAVRSIVESVANK